MTFSSGESALAQLSGFKITNGSAKYGCGIYCYNAHPQLQHLLITSNNDSLNYSYGGGISLDHSDPDLSDIIISDNRAYFGGGIYMTSSGPVLSAVTVSNNSAVYDAGGIGLYSSNPDLSGVIILNNTADRSGGGIDMYSSATTLSNVTISYNSAGSGGGIYFGSSNNPVFDQVERCNIYLNSSSNGKDIYASEPFEIVVDTFSVLYPTDYYVSPLSRFTFDVLNGLIPQVDADLYVSSAGNNDNSGLSEAEPLLNIDYAISILRSDSLHYHTVHLAEGTYSPSATGETFPVNIPDYVNLTGSGADGVILDAEGTGGGLSIASNNANIISGFSITGGIQPGISCTYSFPTLTGLKIFNNNHRGIYCNNSDPLIENVTVTGNSFTGSSSSGGGIYLYYSDPYLSNVTVSYNSVFGYNSQGGGIYLAASFPQFDSINRCNIYLNSAGTGNDLYSGSHLDVIIDTFTVINPNEIHAFPFNNFTFDILHGKLPQVNADLYVSPDGDNENSGLTADNPLRTIRHALTVIYADSLNQNTIHLMEGVYSPSSNGEYFPVTLPDYVNLSGTDASEVILDAEHTGGGIEITDNHYNFIYGLTITGGNKSGIKCVNSDPELVDLTIINCSVSVQYEHGGGICLENSDPVITGVRVLNNSALRYGGTGGGIYMSGSDPVITGVSVLNNSSYDCGGGIIMNGSDPVMSDVTVSNNYTFGGGKGGGIYLSYSVPQFDPVNRCNIYLNKSEGVGQDLYFVHNDTTLLEVVLDTFTVLHPNIIHASPFYSFSFDILNGKMEQVNGDLYVSPEGDNNNSGLTPDDPLMTIHHALTIILADSMNQNTVHLMEGTHSPETNGENSTIYLPDYVHLSGVSENETILLKPSMKISGNKSNHISDLTITNSPGAISCYHSNTLIENVTLIENYASQTGIMGISGGGLFAEYSTVGLYDVSIINNISPANFSEGFGGGIYAYGSDIFLSGVRLSGNIAEFGMGGAIYFENSDLVFDSTNRCNIYLNACPEQYYYYEGYDIAGWSDHIIDVIVDTFTVLYPDIKYAFGNFTFDILHGMIPQERLDLYVSPAGDDANSGQSPDDPLKTIQYAISRSKEDTINIYTIHLANGTYSPSATGEGFPLYPKAWTNLVGESEYGVILNAEGYFSVITLEGYHQEVSSMTITGGSHGINCSGSNPLLKNLFIHGNSNYDNIHYGGGVRCTALKPSFENVTITGNSARQGGGIYFSNNSNPSFSAVNRCNIYFNNAVYGRELYADSHVNVVLDTFTLINPTAFEAYPFENFSFDILHGKLVLAAADLYVSPAGNDSNSGLSNEDPLRTIILALRKIQADSLNQRTIYLAGGTYSPSTTGEVFPLRMKDYVNLSGESRSGVILDAEMQSGVLIMQEIQSAELKNLTITGGNGASHNGGGISMENSSPRLVNLIITKNTGYYDGGGIYMDSSHPYLENVSITDNYAESEGGGIYATGGSGILFDSVNRCNIYNNNAQYIGRDICNYSLHMDVVVDTFTVLYPDDVHAYPINNFTFDIWHSCEYSGDIFVSADGDDDNSGMDPENPLQTIGKALSKFGHNNPVTSTIHLADGIYSPSTNGESFPLSLTTNLKIDGESEENVILDAEGSGSVFYLHNGDFRELANLTVQGGQSPEGGAINCYNVDLKLTHVTIRNNSALAFGGGLCFKFCNPVLENVTITGNTSGQDGGGIYCGSGSEPLLDNVSLSGNSALRAGGGIWCRYITMMNCAVMNNSAEEGGGIYNNYGSNNLTNVLFSDNTAINGGGGISSANSYFKLSNVTFVDNEAGTGVGIYCYNTELEITNSLFWNESSPEIYFEEGFSHSEISVAYSDIRGGEAGIVINEDVTLEWLEGNIDADPLFAGSGEHPYALTAGSPCVDAGTPDTTGLELPAFDVMGNQRAWDGNADGTFIVDIGAYEYGEPATVTETLPDIAACQGDNIAMRVQAAGIPPLHYQWQKDNILISGANDTVLFIPSANFPDEGEYKCFVSNGYGAGASNAALLDVIEVVPSEITGKTEVVEDESVQYSISPQPGHQYVFSVTGGTIIATTENAVTVQWGNPGVGYVYLDEVEEHGCESETVAVEVYISGLGVPSVVSGQQSAVSVYPNPTDGIVDFRFSMVDFRWVSLKIYDVHGREVATVLDGNLAAGEHVVRWDATGLPAGVYVYQLRAKGVGQGAVGKIVKY